MTRETKGEIVVTALVVSALVHVGVMLYARPKVMTRVAAGGDRSAMRAPMRVTKAAERPEPTLIEAVEDVAALREAPKVQAQEVAAPLPSDVPEVTPVAVSAAVATPPQAPDAVVAPPVFDAKPPSADDAVSAKIPMAKIETPPPAVPSAAPPTAMPSAPPSAPLLPAASAVALPSDGTDADSAFLPTRLASAAPSAASAFVPAQEVYEKVDAAVVEEEKAAVKALVESEDAAELPKFVSTAMTRARSGGWDYFRVMVSPRASLPVVPKDFVVLIDASGSIGRDRIASVRKAAGRVLRSATNTGDRFNLVAFRDRFSYLSKSWMPCDQAAFDRADKWLGNVAAHGRTDVFATIASVLTLPRDPSRPLVALVVTDGEANSGVRETSQILSRFTALNDGLVSVYMYGVKGAANRELIAALTRGNRGEGYVYDGRRGEAGSAIDGFTEAFRDPVLTDLRVIFAAETRAEAYPRLLKNLYRGGTLEIVGRVPAGTEKVSFALRGLAGAKAYEGFFTHELGACAVDEGLPAAWAAEEAVDRRLR